MLIGTKTNTYKCVKGVFCEIWQMRHHPHNEGIFLLMCGKQCCRLDLYFIYREKENHHYEKLGYWRYLFLPAVTRVNLPFCYKSLTTVGNDRMCDRLWLRTNSDEKSSCFLYFVIWDNCAVRFLWLRPNILLEAFHFFIISVMFWNIVDVIVCKTINPLPANHVNYFFNPRF